MVSKRFCLVFFFNERVQARLLPLFLPPESGYSYSLAPGRLGALAWLAEGSRLKPPTSEPFNYGEVSVPALCLVFISSICLRPHSTHRASRWSARPPSRAPPPPSPPEPSRAVPAATRWRKAAPPSSSSRPRCRHHQSKAPPRKSERHLSI